MRDDRDDCLSQTPGMFAHTEKRGAMHSRTSQVALGRNSIGVVRGIDKILRDSVILRLFLAAYSSLLFIILRCNSNTIKLSTNLTIIFPIGQTSNSEERLQTLVSSLKMC